MLVSLGACTDPEGAKRVLENQGYTNVEITGWKPFSGDKNDFYETGFRAKSPNGMTVEGTVTKGLLFKGSTIRFE